MKAYKNTRIALFGASGFIGRWVALKLYEAGAEITAFSRTTDHARRVLAFRDIDSEHIQIDLRASDSEITAAITSANPQVIFNLAGYGIDRSERDNGLAQRINAEIPALLASALSDLDPAGWKNQRLIHVGSALEYGEIAGDLSEDSPTNATTLYGKTKLAGTLDLKEAAIARELPSLTARLFTVYGPGEHPARLLPTIINMARSNEEIPLTGGLQKRDFTFVGDVADGLLRLGLSTAKLGEIINLASGELQSVRAMIEATADACEISRERLRFGDIPTRAEEMAHAPVNNARLRELTAWSPDASLRQGVEQTFSSPWPHSID